jgi:asparagine synthase (glutamine-hydrolysing)
MGEKGLSKRILREALRGIVPDPILDRRDKIGFATPEQAWWKDLYPWIQRHLEGDTLRSLPFFQPRLVEKEWREVMQGKAPFDFRIWRWVNLIRWFELFQVELPQRF